MVGQDYFGENILDSAASSCDDDARFCGVMYTVYGDESHDEARERVFAVAGLFGSEAQWASAKKAWVDRTRGKVFHAAECETDAGDFAGSPHSDNQRLYKDLTTILAASRLLGYGHAMALDAFTALFPEAVKDQPYYMCFQEVVARFAQYTLVCIPPDKVEFIFDRNCEVEYNASFVYLLMAKLPEWRFHEFLADKVSYASRKEPGIQMADLVARETMKHMDNAVGPTKRPARRSMLALAKTGRFKFDFFTREYFRDLKRNIGRLMLPGQAMSDYDAWRQRHRLVDSAEHRIRYMTYVRSTARREA